MVNSSPLNPLTTPLYFRDGTLANAYEVRRGRGNVYFVARPVTCCRCGGTGIFTKFHGECYRCGGRGQTPADRDHVVKVYTAEQNAKLDAAQAQRDAVKAAKNAVVVAAREAQERATAATFDAAYPALAQVVTTDALLLDIVARGRRIGSLSANQLALAESLIAKAQAQVALQASSHYVGTVGGKVTMLVTCANVASFDRTPFGGWANQSERVYICTFVTSDGQVLVTKTPRFNVERGATGTLVGTVKAHSEYQGVKQTQLQRASFVNS